MKIIRNIKGQKKGKKIKVHGERLSDNELFHTAYAFWENKVREAIFPICKKSFEIFSSDEATRRANIMTDDILRIIKKTR